MKESITKFDLEAAFKALDTISIPKAEKGIKANKPALTEIFSRKTGFDALMEEYYDVGSTEELSDAKEAREAEIAKAKLARIEKIVDLDADSPEDLLTSYVGKYIIQCPQCMTLFYKSPEDVEESEEDPNTVNVNEVCQHCGNESGYTLIGKVGAAEPEEAPEDTTDETSELEEPEESSEDTEDNTEDAEDAGSAGEDDEFDLDVELDELDFEIEDDETEEKKEESLESQPHSDTVLMEQLTEDSDLDVSAEDFEKLIKSSEFQRPISDTAARAMMQEFSDSDEEASKQEESLEEGIFDKLKSRNDKAQWILENTLKDFKKLSFNSKGKLQANKENRRFDRFVVVGFTDKFVSGKKITMSPQPTNSNLVIDMERVITKAKYKDADQVAQGWSVMPGNGPAHIYLAKSAKDPEAAFLCSYFEGKLQHDQTEKYYEATKKALGGAKKMVKGRAFDDFYDEEDVEQTEESLNTATISKNLLEDFVSSIENIHENSLSEQLSNHLITNCETIAGFKLQECQYCNNALELTGKVFYCSGKTEKTTYILNEAYQNTDKKIILKGFNKSFDTKVSLIGYAKKSTKTFITESFKA